MSRKVINKVCNMFDQDVLKLFLQNKTEVVSHGQMAFFFYIRMDQHKRGLAT